jgi:uncharacterized protein YggE
MVSKLASKAPAEKDHFRNPKGHMKCATVSLLLIVLTAKVFAQPLFSVSGYGRIFYEPDSYDLSFGVVTEDSDVQRCKATHLAALGKVKEFLDRSKDKTLSLKQDATKLETVDPPNRGRVFRFTTSYVARVKETKSLAPLQEGLVSAGVTDIIGLDLFSEKLPQLLERARKEAIKDAKNKAELAASELGWAITGASGISFQDGEWQGQRTSNTYGSRAFAYDPAKRPELTTYVVSQVNVSFTFEKKK